MNELTVREKLALFSALQFFLGENFGRNILEPEEYTKLRDLFVDYMGEIDGDDDAEFGNIMLELANTLKADLLEAAE
jgi:hypothetical protein